MTSTSAIALIALFALCHAYGALALADGGRGGAHRLHARVHTRAQQQQSRVLDARAGVGAGVRDAGDECRVLHAWLTGLAPGAGPGQFTTVAGPAVTNAQTLGHMPIPGTRTAYAAEIRATLGPLVAYIRWAHGAAHNAATTCTLAALAIGAGGDGDTAGAKAAAMCKFVYRATTTGQASGSEALFRSSALPASADAAVGVAYANHVLANDLWTSIRFARRSGTIGDCDRLTAVRATIVARAPVGKHHPSYTAGVEWELHWAEILPAVPGANSADVAESGSVGNAFGLPWLKVAVDHTSNNLINPGGAAHQYAISIAELVFGPGDVDVTQHGNASPSGITFGDTRQIVTNVRAEVTRLSAASHTNRHARNYGEVTTTAVCAALDVANADAVGHRATQRPHARYTCAPIIPPPPMNPAHIYPPQYPEFSWRATSTERGPALGPPPAPLSQVAAVAPANMYGNEAIQTNFLMPVSALAAADVHQLNAVGAAGAFAWRRSALHAARLAARTTLLDNAQFPAARIAALTAEQRGDLLGLLTLFNYQFAFNVLAISGLYTRAEQGNYRNTEKNWFEYMPKTSFHECVSIADESVALLLTVWAETQHQWANAPQREAYWDGILAAWDDHGNDAIVRAWRTKAHGQGVNGAIRTHALDVLSIWLPALDPAAARVSNMIIPNPSPSISRPPAYLIGVNNVLSAVMESRDPTNTLNAAVTAAPLNVQNINTIIAPLMQQRSWDGTVNNFCA